jgi:hypothetical protein
MTFKLMTSPESSSEVSEEGFSLDGGSIGRSFDAPYPIPAAPRISIRTKKTFFFFIG